MIVEAGMVNLLKTLLILALVYYGFKFLAKLFAPQIQKYAAKKMQEKFNQHYQGGVHQEEKREPEGKTTVVNKPKKDKDINTDDAGEYIDYEEVD
ncbi:MAG: DUF4834 family protein [Bacteroidota bacterium]